MRGSSAHGSPAWAFGLVFVLGLAAGTLLSGRSHLPGNPPAIPAARAAIPEAASQSAFLPRQTWSRDGHPGVRHAAEMVRVVDGDTFEARVHLWPGLEMTTRVRLRGIDAPEMKGACAEEARMADAAGEVAIFNIGPDKYNGRVVADAMTRRTPSVSDALLASGHARPYQGGRRGGWCGANFRAG